MSNSVKLILIIASALVVIGLIIGCIGFFVFGGLRKAEDFEEFTETYSADIKEIRTDVDTADIKVYRSEGDDITVRYYDNDKHYFNIEEDDGALYIERSEVHRTWFINFSFWFNESIDYELEIGIPDNFKGELKLKAITGDIDASDIDLQADTIISSTTGDIKLKNFTCNGNVSVEVTTGDIKLNTVNVKGDLSFDGVTSDIRGRDVVCNGDFTASSTTGGFEIDDLTADTVKATVTACGNIEINRMSVNKSIYLKAVTGDVYGSVTDKAENYSITSDVTVGDNGLTNLGGHGDKQLKVYVTTGDIEFDFGK